MDTDYSRIQFTELLSRCHNIIRDNDKLSPEAAFDETSKILFIKIQRERNKGSVYSMADYFQEKNDYLNRYAIDNIPYYQFIFRQTKDKYKEEEIFEDYDTIKIREHTFEAIIGCLESLNLASIEDDVKGIAFEFFLGRTFRGELGQFFTPRAVVNFMVSVLNPKEGDLVCDPCCGSGGFLISVFDDVRKRIESDSTANKEEKKERIRKLSTSCLFGVDANARMARVAKMNMIMHGDGHTCVYHHDGLLNINGVFENRFDIILTNPPFGSRVNKDLLISDAEKFSDEEKKSKNIATYGSAFINALSQVEDNIGKPLLSLYKTGKYTNITEVLFIERCLNLLKPGGRMGIVLPEGVLSNENLQPVREYIESKATILFIVSLPNDVFVSSGAAVKSSIMFFQKKMESDEKLYQQVLSEEKAVVDNKYGDTLHDLKASLKCTNDERESAVLKGQIAKIKKLKHNELYASLRSRLNYQIPKAEVNSGVNGLETQLSELLDEYKTYQALEDE